MRAGAEDGAEEERLSPPDELPPDERPGLLVRGVAADGVPEERLGVEAREVPPEERLGAALLELLPDEPLGAAARDEPLGAADLPGEEERLGAADPLGDEERDAPPELPPDERLTPPDEREPPPDAPELPREARCASTRFTGAAIIITANAAQKKNRIRLGVSISDLHLSSDAGNEKSPAGRFLCQ